MANRAYLLAVDDPGVLIASNPRREVIAEGINELPVFWASLFTGRDNRLDRYSEGARIRNWCVKSPAAIRRLERLHPAIRKLLDRPAAGVWQKWVWFMSRQKADYFKVNAAEVRDLNPRGYEGYRRALERAFSDPSIRTMRAAARRNGIEIAPNGFKWELETTVCKLAGAEHLRRLPWFSQRVVYPPAVGEETRNVFDEIFDAISPDESLEEAVRKARMMVRKGRQ